MLMGFAVSVSLCEAEINNMDDMGLFAQTKEEILGLNVSVHKVLCV
jgi:hypothetical protein